MRTPGARPCSALPPARRPAQPVERRRRRAHGPHRRANSHRAARRQPALPRASLPLGRRHAPSRAAAGARHPRPLRPGTRSLARHPPLAGSRPLGRAPTPRSPRARSRRRRCLRLQSGRRPAAAPDPRRPRACGHHRARPLPLFLQRRDGGAAGGAAGLRAQGHRRAHARRPPGEGGKARRPHLRRQHGCRRRWPSHARWKRHSVSSRRRAPSICAR